MSFESERATIMGYLSSNWSPSDPPINYENKDFTQPETTWLDALLLGLDSKRASLGGPHHLNRYWGELQVTVLVPQNDGTKNSNILVDKIVALFDNLELTCGDGDSIVFQTPKKLTLGLSNGRYRIIVRCPFYRDSRT